MRKHGLDGTALEAEFASQPGNRVLIRLRDATTLEVGQTLAVTLE